MTLLMAIGWAPSMMPPIWAEDPRRARVPLLAVQDGRVLVEAGVAAVDPPVVLGEAHGDRPNHVALLDGGVRSGLLDAGDDDVTDPRRGLLGAADDPDALDRPGARVVGHLEAGLLLDHPCLSAGTGFDSSAAALGAPPSAGPASASASDALASGRASAPA